MATKKSTVTGDASFIYTREYDYLHVDGMLTKEKCIIAAQKAANESKSPCYVIQVVGVCRPKQKAIVSKIPTL